MNLSEIATRKPNVQAKAAFRQRPNKEDEWGRVDEAVAMAYGNYMEGNMTFPEAVTDLIANLKPLLI